MSNETSETLKACPDCGHRHEDAKFGYICIGCPCPPVRVIDPKGDFHEVSINGNDMFGHPADSAVVGEACPKCRAVEDGHICHLSLLPAPTEVEGAPLVQQDGGMVERLRMEAQGHAMEARTQRGTVRDIYQVVTGAIGEPGDWNGANPVRERIGQLIATLEHARACLMSLTTDSGNDPVSRQMQKMISEITGCLDASPALSAARKGDCRAERLEISHLDKKGD